MNNGGVLGMTGHFLLNKTSDNSAMMSSSIRTKMEQSMLNNYYKNQKKQSVGNNSRNASSWVCGPKHEIRDQRIPGYTGFIQGVHSENIYAKSYSRCAAKSLNANLIRGYDLTPDKRFVTQNIKEFSPKNFRRIVEKPELASKKDYLEYSTTINAKEMEQRNRVLNSSLDHIVSKGSVYNDMSDTTLSPMKTFMGTGNRTGFAYRDPN
eukprot:CAMPEP_0170546054 /NCGR_PEP_ID=MMETSP0211-20121228/4424_1 /TAXON_ID=311385 /ORGANISM="Pseudokeronopsis sp., Strain OXSARD2" /LENGTH=207 /DNA_ID=CAMNT_0010850301 /DNA_START=73 /DNA_END=696 /DNA_ORIENTATION=+